MTSRNRFAALFAAFALGIAASALPVAAQQSGGATSFSDEKLSAVAEVMSEIEQIRDRYRAEIQSTDDPDRQQQLVREGNREMAVTVEEAPDVSIDELNAVLEAAAVDDALRARLDAEIESKMQ